MSVCTCEGVVGIWTCSDKQTNSVTDIFETVRTNRQTDLALEIILSTKTYLNATLSCQIVFYYHRNIVKVWFMYLELTSDENWGSSRHLDMFGQTDKQRDRQTDKDRALLYRYPACFFWTLLDPLITLWHFLQLFPSRYTK